MTAVPIGSVDYMAQRPLRVSSNATIHHPVAAVFAVLSDPHQLTALSPEATLIGEIEELPAGGFRVRAAARWHSQIGYRFTIETEHYDPPSRITLVCNEVQRSSLGKLLRLRISERVEYALTPGGDDSTQVTATVTWPGMSRPSSWLMPPLMRRSIRARLRRIEQLIDARP